MPGKILAELEGTTAAPTTEPKKVKGEKRRRQKGGDAETTMEEENEKETPEEVKRAKKAKKRERRQEEEEETQTVPEKSPKKKKKRKSEESEEAQVVEEVEVEPKKPKSSSKKRKLPPTSPPSPASAKGEEAPLSAASISSTTSSLSGEEVEAGGNAEVLSEEQIAGAFSNFNISDKTISLLRGRGVSYLFPVQCLSLEPIMAGWDLVAQARTGTGKTLAFAIPLVELLRQRHGTGSAAKYGRLPQVLVMCPTRELAVQVADDLRAIAAPLRVACFYGGTAYGPQLQQIRSGLDVLVGTPGRLRDLIQNHGLRLRAKHNNEEEDSSKKKKDEEVVVVEEVEKDEKKGGKKNGGKEEGVRHVVLDEVDQMLDMGFADQVEEILGCIYSKASPENNPQTLLFSATCPPWVFKVAQKFMKETWRRVDLMGTEKTRAATTVQHLAVCCPRSERAVCLGSVLRVYAAGLPGGHAVNPVGSSGGHGVASVGSSRGRAIVFCETKKEAAELALSPAIAQEAQCLHGDVPQQQREACLRAFRSGAIRVLVATDVAARGLDVPEVELVVQCQPPHDVESYIHRSGRTGRAGRTGISICFYQERDAGTLRAIESKAGFVFKRIAVPSANEVLAASTQDVIRSLESVSARVVSRFRLSVEKLLSHRDPWELLSAALSLLAGYDGDDNRSLLTSLKGYTTLILRSSVPLSHSSAAWRALKEELGEQRAEEMVRGMRLLKGKTGVCFDVPENKVEEMKAAWPPSKRWNLEEADERPDLEEINFTAGGGGGGGRWRGGGGGGGGGGGRRFGNGGGGRSGGGGGGGRWRGGGGGGGRRDGGRR
ncbi:ATP-dependent RNA helicase DDX50-like isoform X1 [Petromyzon marinus]|uniref:ATP-dependent RNA helicase DDX50-like isoform X1 n=1 Tax=Petromyzon marinus TaxID=7757 RepID=UPI003F6E8B66